MSNNSQYEKWRDDILQQVATTICQPCTDPRKKAVRINLENPLECECSCGRVEVIIKHMREINLNMQHQT